jgi:hypothetical protein
MDAVTTLRDLWRHRFIVVSVYLVALLAGTAVLYTISFPPKLESRRYQVGVATARLLVDTPSSQVVEIAPKGSESLGVRANLIASLMVDGVVKTAIAKRAGLQPDELVGIASSATDQPAPPPKNPHASVLTTKVVTDNDGAQLPIIEISTQAADDKAAAALATAALNGLRDYLDSKAAVQQIPDAQRLQVNGLGAPQAELVTRGPKNLFAVAAVIFVFGLGCAGILAVLALVRGWHAASGWEGSSGVGLLGEDEGVDLLGEDEGDDVDLDPPPTEPAAVSANGDGGDDGWSESWLTPSRPALVRTHDDEPEAESA